MSSLLAKLDCPQHGAFGHALAPLERRDLWHRVEVAKLDRRDRRFEVFGDALPDR